MQINLTNHKITLDKVDTIEKFKLEEHESATLSFISKWIKKENDFLFRTSGSTGKPKDIILKRDQLVLSASNTLDAINFKGSSALLCLNPTLIGGAMVIVRALLNNQNLTVTKPSNFPIVEETYDLVSLVPTQIQEIVRRDPESLNRFKNILIGGAPISSDLERILINSSFSANIFFTYGMTETASNVALRRLGEDFFEGVGDVQFSKNEEGCLEIHGSITGNRMLSTNDQVQIIDPKRFKWLGRNDFIINSGGIKVNPEQLESQLSKIIDEKHIISSLPHDKLGEEVILIVEGQARNIDLSRLEVNKYQKPKRTFFVESMLYLPSGKIDRKKTTNSIKS